MPTTAPLEIHHSGRPRVVIVGGGFGGVRAAKALTRTPVDVFIIDRSNHHLFQPLLYQVATSTLAPHNIASPIRRIFRSDPNVMVFQGEVTSVDPAKKEFSVKDAPAPLRFDYLALNTMRFATIVQWVLSALTNQRSARLIIETREGGNGAIG